jgi:hypothetical protein
VNPAEKKRLGAAIRGVFWAFEHYARPLEPNFCGLCHDDTERRYYQVTPLENFTEDMARRLAWESADHWSSTEVFKHYLPVILERLAPPNHLDDMTYTHWMDTLKWHKFATWSNPERTAIGVYARCVLDLVPEAEHSGIGELRAGLQEIVTLAETD